MPEQRKRPWLAAVGIVLVALALVLAAWRRPSAPSPAPLVARETSAAHASASTRSRGETRARTGSERDRDAPSAPEPSSLVRGPTAPAPTTAPRREDEVWEPSPVSDVPATVRVENRCDESVVLAWVDYDGRERVYGTIHPGRFWAQATFAGHAWIVRRERDHRIVARFASAEGAVVAACAPADESATPRAPLTVEEVPPSCPVCSPRTSTPAGFDVLSRCHTPVRLVWRDFDGRTRPYGLVAPGGSLHQGSYTGHRWELVDEDGAVVARHVVAEDGEVVVACDDA